jgi:hypothetical protein
MDAVDYAQLGLLLISVSVGSTGILGWILTYVQLRRETRERALQQLRELVLTPDFLRYLGILHHMSVVAARGESLLRVEQQILNDPSLTPEDREKKVKELEDERGYSLPEMTDEWKRIRKDMDETYEKITYSGVRFLMSEKIENMITECIRFYLAANKIEEYSAVTNRVKAIFAEIKRMLGLTIFE